MVARLTPGGSRRTIVVNIVLYEQPRRRLFLRCLAISSVYDLKKLIAARAITSGHRHFVPEQAAQVDLWLRGHRLRDPQKLFEADLTVGCEVILARL